MATKDSAKGGKAGGKSGAGAQAAPNPKADKKAEKAARSARPSGDVLDMSAPVPATRMRDIYREKIVPELMKQFNFTSVMQVPRIEKITLNMGVGEAVADKKILDNAVGDMTKIAGQKPVITVSRKAIAGFKIREGYPIGCMVTLRGVRMYEFLDRLITVALPRVRDFRGVSGRAFDGRGNFNFGVKEQIIFPEVEYDKVDAVRGLNISITTSALSDEQAKALLSAFRFPFRN